MIHLLKLRLKCPVLFQHSNKPNNIINQQEQTPEEISKMSNSLLELESSFNSIIDDINHNKNLTKIDETLYQLSLDIPDWKIAYGRYRVLDFSAKISPELQEYGNNYKPRLLRQDFNLIDKYLATTKIMHALPANNQNISQNLGKSAIAGIDYRVNLTPENTIEARRAFIAIIFSAIVSLTLLLMFKGKNIYIPKFTHPGTGLLQYSRIQQMPNALNLEMTQLASTSRYARFY